jgi:hypothetical protein
MLSTVSVDLPGAQARVVLDVVRRVGGLGRADEFFLSEASVLRAGGRNAKDVMHSSCEVWFDAGFKGTIGKAAVEYRAFRQVFPRETVYVRRAEALGLAAAGANDPWYLSLSAGVFLLLRVTNVTWAAASKCHRLVVAAFHALLVSATAGAQAAATPLSPPRRARIVVSAPPVLGVRADSPQTPVLSRGRNAALLAPVQVERAAGVGDALAAAEALRDLLEDAPSVAVAGAAGPAGAAAAVAAVAPVDPVAEPLSVRLNRAMEAIPFDDPNTDVPLTASLGPVVEHVFTSPYPGKVELERRLVLAGHSMMLAKPGATRGPWTVVYRGESRVHVLMERFGRRTLGKLSLNYSTKGEPCTAVLAVAHDVCAEVAACLQTAVPIQLPPAYECVRDRIELDRSLFPVHVRADPSTGSTFSRLLEGEADIVLLSSMRMLVRTTRFSCAHCGVACRSNVDFQRSQFHQLECFAVCSSCRGVSTFFTEELDKSQQLLRRAGAFATMCSFPSPEAGHRFFQFMGMPNYARLRCPRS